MKTILYQPIFINPQAYFVFPSLYHIEKGDSFIEPANITGQLIINTLTDDPTLTPIILTVKDNNQVDFSIFASKHIRISQYTDEGAVVLGEWYIPGTPEPEYPDWFKDSVIALYDPAKQGMTNYDVIEAYVEDFTNWNYVKARGVATISQHKFIITECILKGLGIVEDIREPYSNLTVRIIGITDNQEVLITDYVNGQHQIINTITEDGIYTIEDRHHFVGFGCNFVGTCNITIEQLPTSILKDLSGNGNHAYLYGGKGKLNSGIGLYTYDYNSDRWSSTGRADYIITKKGFEFTNIIEDGGIIFALGSNIAKEGDKVKVKISGIPNGGRVYFGTWITATEDGEYLGTYAYDNNGNTTIGTFGCIGATITLEFIPDYPDQLCYDGGMCAVAYEFPILTDYTIIADRTWFDIRDISCFIGKRNGSGDNLGAFEFEFRANKTFSFGGNNNIIFADNNIVYQTKNSYNGAEIKSGSLDDTDVLIIGAAQRNVNDKAQDPYIGCHGKIIIADRSFTEEEINWLKENIYNIEI